MKCANCQAEGEPAYTLRAHVEREGTGEEDDGSEAARTDGGATASATVDLPFCSLGCLTAWT